MSVHTSRLPDSHKLCQPATTKYQLQLVDSWSLLVMASLYSKLQTVHIVNIHQKLQHYLMYSQGKPFELCQNMCTSAAWWQKRQFKCIAATKLYFIYTKFHSFALRLQTKKLQTLIWIAGSKVKMHDWPKNALF